MNRTAASLSALLCSAAISTPGTSAQTPSFEEELRRIQRAAATQGASACPGSRRKSLAWAAERRDWLKRASAALEGARLNLGSAREELAGLERRLRQAPLREEAMYPSSPPESLPYGVEWNPPRNAKVCSVLIANAVESLDQAQRGLGEATLAAASLKGMSDDFPGNQFLSAQARRLLISASDRMADEAGRAREAIKPIRFDLDAPYNRDSRPGFHKIKATACPRVDEERKGFADRLGSLAPGKEGFAAKPLAALEGVIAGLPDRLPCR